MLTTKTPKGYHARSKSYGGFWNAVDANGNLLYSAPDESLFSTSPEDKKGVELPSLPSTPSQSLTASLQSSLADLVKSPRKHKPNT